MKKPVKKFKIINADTNEIIGYFAENQRDETEERLMFHEGYAVVEDSERNLCFTTEIED